MAIFTGRLHRAHFQICKASSSPITLATAGDGGEINRSGSQDLVAFC
jgi:hypothetical protein